MSRARPGRRHAAAGFTLVEVMVGLALLAMLMTVIVTAIRVGTRSWSQAEARAGDVDAMNAVQDLLRRTIAAARPAFASPDPAVMTVRFTGEPDALSLIAPLPGSQGAGPWTPLQLHLARAGAVQGLFLSWPDGATGRPHDEMLLDHVTALRLAYYGPPAPGEPAGWQPRWAGRERLPALVRIGIRRGGTGLPDWPELVIATRVDANATCAPEPSGNGCRRMR
jgi:general secretion pathway protein J